MFTKDNFYTQMLAKLHVQLLYMINIRGGNLLWFSLTTNVSPLKIFLLHNQSTKIGDHGETIKVFPTNEYCQ